MSGSQLGNPRTRMWLCPAPPSRVGSSGVLASRGQPQEQAYHLEIDHNGCRTMGKNGPQTGLFALLTLLNVDTDARTHNQHMVIPNAPHRMRRMSIHGQDPSQEDAKVQNRHNEPLETADLLRRESILGILNRIKTRPESLHSECRQRCLECCHRKFPAKRSRIPQQLIL